MKKEIKIALVVICCLAMLFFGLNFLKGVQLFGSKDTYYLTFYNIEGVTKNCPVKADGVTIGSVTDIIYDYQHEKPTTLVLSIDDQMRIPKGSSAEVKADLMGNTEVRLLLANNPRERILPGETFNGSNEAALMQKLAEMMPRVEAIVPKLDSIMSSLNTLLADPALANTLHNAENITANLTQTSAQLNTLVAGLNTQVPGILNKADHMLANTDKITSDIARVDLAATMQNVDAAILNVKQTTERLQSTDNSLGLLLNDTRLYDNLNTVVTDADQLVVDLKQNPKRYVHFSVFGRKN